MVHIWWFPEIRLPPVIMKMYFHGIFHEMKHPAMGVPPFSELETPIYSYWDGILHSKGARSQALRTVSVVVVVVVVEVVVLVVVVVVTSASTPFNCYYSSLPRESIVLSYSWHHGLMMIATKIHPNGPATHFSDCLTEPWRPGSLPTDGRF